MFKWIGRIFVLIVVVGLAAAVFVIYSAYTVVKNIANVGCIASGNAKCIAELSIAIAGVFQPELIPGSATMAPCNAVNVAEVTRTTAVVPLDATFEEAVIAATGGRPRLTLSVLMRAGFATEFGTVANQEGEFGEVGITIWQSLAINAARAEDVSFNVPLVVSWMEAELPNTTQTGWENSTAMTAALLITNALDDDFPDNARVQDIYQKSIVIMKQKGWSTDFKGDVVGGPDSTGTDSLQQKTLIGDLDGKKVPEPLRSIWIAAGAAEDIDPGIIAGLYLSENNGFIFTRAEYDGKGEAAYTDLTPTSAEWKLEAFGANGLWERHSTGYFQGPFQFDNREGRAWSTFGRDGDNDGVKDIYSVIDASYAAAAYIKYLGGKKGDVVSNGNAARQYNGQVKWEVYGFTIYNPDPSKFSRPQDLYGYQAAKLAVALSGGDISGQTAVNACAAQTSQNISQNTGPTGSAARDEVKKFAMSWLGTRYSWGGGSLTGPTNGTTYMCSAACYANNDPTTPGLDCSGFVRLAFYQGTQFEIPRTSEAQYNAIGTGTFARTLETAKPFDLVFWHGHVAFVLGDGQMIEAPQSGSQVKVSKIRQNQRGFGDPFAYAGITG